MPWDMIAKVALMVAFELLLLAGLIAIPLGLSGNFIILGLAFVVALLTKFQTITPWMVGVMLVLAVAGEVIESTLGSVMARRYGASKWGMIGAFAGGIAGAILGTPIAPVIGTIIGSFVGAAAGAVLLEWIHLRRLRPSMPAGWGAVLGKLASSLIKICIGLAMAIYLNVRVIAHLFP